MSTPTPPNQPPNQPQWQQPHQPPGQNMQPGPQPPYQGQGQPPYGQHPGATTFAPPPPQKKKHGLGFWLLIAVLVIVALIFVSCAAALAGGAGSGSAAPAASSTGAADDGNDPTEEPTKKATKEPSAKAEPDTATIGDTVKAGDWQFKVTDFDCGKTKVGDEYLGKKAQGQFCFLKLTAKNNGDSEATLTGESQKLSDDDGKTYSNDTEASLYEDPDSLLFLEGVNPGNTAKGTVIFDVPKKAEITKVTLSGGLFGGSAEISLK